MSPTPLSSAVTQRLTTTVPVWESRSAAPQFEFGRVEGSIVADVSANARGLTVEQHTERVLVQLLGERDAPL